jgi:ribonuclease P protein component
MGLPRQCRVRKSREFLLLRNNGLRAETAGFTLFFIRESGNSRRAGVVASRRVGNAVRRNRAKRILREVFRLHADALPQGCAVALIARARLLEFSLTEVSRHFLKACAWMRCQPVKEPCPAEGDGLVTALHNEVKTHP